MQRRQASLAEMRDSRRSPGMGLAMWRAFPRSTYVSGTREWSVVILRVRHTRTGACTAGRDAGRPAETRLRTIRSPELHRSSAASRRSYGSATRIGRRVSAAQPQSRLIPHCSRPLAAAQTTLPPATERRWRAHERPPAAVTAAAAATAPLSRGPPAAPRRSTAASSERRTRLDHR